MANPLAGKRQLKDEAGAANEPFSFDVEQHLEGLSASWHNSATDNLWTPPDPHAEFNNGRGSPPCTTLQETTGTSPMMEGLPHAPPLPLAQQPAGLVLQKPSRDLEISYTWLGELWAAEEQSLSFPAGTSPGACLYELGAGQVHTAPDPEFSTQNAALPTWPPPSVNTPATMQTYSSAEVEGTDTAVMTLIRVETDDILKEDGFTWRKYGNKPIKNTAFKKASFKCAEHVRGCKALRWIQKCTDEEGYVDFTYKGRHNHPRPSGH